MRNCVLLARHMTVCMCVLAVVSCLPEQRLTAQEKAAASEGSQDAAKNTKRSKKPPAPFRWVNKSKNAAKEVLHRTFHSQSMNVDVGYNIVLPPEYDAAASTRYPVVYYLHGGRPGSEAKGVSIGKMVWDVMKSGEVAPAIYVFPNGGPVSHYNMPADEGKSRDPARQGASVFIKELIPHIDATYKTIAKRSGRGLEGFSQGGRGTMRLALRYPGLFCSVAAGGGGYATEKKISESDGYENPKLRFSPGDNAWDLARAYVKGDYPRFTLMVYVGSKGINYENNLEYMGFLKSLKIVHTPMIVADVPHSGRMVYEKRGLEIMRFHSANFVRAATLDSTDGNGSFPVQNLIR